MKHKITVKAVGDIAPGDYSVDGLGTAAVTNRYNGDYLFKELNDLLFDADLVLGNLEGTLSTQRCEGYLRLCGLPEIAESLKRAGFDILSVANNHVLDHGVDTFNETVSYCRNAGIEICGLRGRGEYFCEPVIIERNNVQIGVLAYNWIGAADAGVSGDHIATIHDGIVNYTWDRNADTDKKVRNSLASKNENVINDIERLRGKVDLVILMPHWGYEWVNNPPYGVILEARYFIESGADIIIGSHPHVIQGVEQYNKGLIAYSLGNFLFDSCSKKFGSGMVLSVAADSSGYKEHHLKFIDWTSHFQPIEAEGRVGLSLGRILDRSNETIGSDNIEVLLDDDLIYREYEDQYNRMKLEKVIYLLKKLPTNPFLLRPIANKIITFVEIMYLRLRGQRVRW